MRIIGEFDKNGIKITVFKMNDKLSIKFENNLLEQTFKFRDGSGIDNLSQAEAFCNDKTMESVTNTFIAMSNLRSERLVGLNTSNTIVFDTII